MSESNQVRLDKWLWAARFFKTRSLAKQAIAGGKVRCHGKKIKPSREIAVGEELTIRQGWDEKIVIVVELIEQRRSAKEAQLLYEETTISQENRKNNAVQRKLTREMMPQFDSRLNKKERRVRVRFKRDFGGED